MKARLARALTERDPTTTAEMLTQIEGETQEALEDLRDLARGIYPPLLADKGLGAALEAQARKSRSPSRSRSAASVASRRRSRRRLLLGTRGPAEHREVCRRVAGDRGAPPGERLPGVHGRRRWDGVRRELDGIRHGPPGHGRQAGGARRRARGLSGPGGTAVTGRVPIGADTKEKVASEDRR